MQNTKVLDTKVSCLETTSFDPVCFTSRIIFIINLNELNGLNDLTRSVKQGGLESLIRGMLKDPLMKIDRYISEELTKHLFETTDKFGNF